MTEPIVKKKRVQSKQKGNGFERAVSKILSERLTPLKFIRSPGSGARLGGVNFEKFGSMFGKDVSAIFIGDVVPTNETESQVKFLCNVECKFYKDVPTLQHLLKGSIIESWMSESIVDALKTDKTPVLIFKFNRSDIFFATTVIIDKPIITIHSEKCGDIFVTTFDKILEQKDFWMK